ncbi:TnsD family Tn7-like transposition protein [Rheinheimera baltica]|uniref:TnsD family Tn7-like transposition protein n=1 Tax=Rheinheimera baltica TaxID=67576 RepID=A0ABT9HX19_9GAMM|nr:TnsD family Tn7-like transposition protein [Rheinheimera baltica]MDP5135680.1 TnsD family Tn7-like transposition protein [Rheinheimera baltica]
MFQLPKALPDELLLSRLIRFVTISGISSGEFLQDCFGSKKTSLHPFLTSGLYSIAKLCNEDAISLLKEQTLAPLFFFYLPAHAPYLRSMMLTNNGAKAFRASQLVSFGSGQSLGLKSCSLCVQNDISEFGVSYWHRSHQIPGVNACGRHGTTLHFLELTQRQRLIGQLLPQFEVEIQYSPHTEILVAKFSAQLLNLLTVKEPTLKITDAYRYYLEEKGYLTHGCRVRRKELMHDFSNYISNHRNTNLALIPRGHKDFRYLSQLLEVDGSHHPYRHLLFGTWLFINVEQIFTCPPQSARIEEAVSTDKKNSEQVVEEKCLDLLKTGTSLAQISRETGKSRCYLKRIALLNGVSVNLKPKILTQQIIKAICSLAYAGFHRREIAKRCRVGIGTVEQTISSHPGLVERRQECHFQSSRRKNRLFLRRFIAEHPDSIRRDIKQRCCAAFFWLYLNDREWLEEHLPKSRIAKGRY